MKPLMPTIELMPSANPRCEPGNASVTSAVLLANSSAEPMPWMHTEEDELRAGLREAAQRRGDGEDGEAERVRPDPALHVGQPRERHHQRGDDELVAHHDPHRLDDGCVERVGDVRQGDR